MRRSHLIAFLLTALSASAAYGSPNPSVGQGKVQILKSNEFLLVPDSPFEVTIAGIAKCG
jgi:hypothetical protein